MNNDPPNIDSAGDGPTHFGEEPPERDVKPERHAESGSPPENFRIPESDGELDTLRPTPRLSQFVSPGLELPPDLEREHLAVVLKAGDVVNERFEVLEMVGLGGMGAVYRVRDVLMGQTRALKVMLPSLVHSEDAQRRFMSEVSISQQLRHEGVVAVYDLGLDQVRGTRFFTMEFIEGKTLHRMLRERGGKAATRGSP